MINKLLVIYDIVFKNGQYIKATKNLFVKDNLYIKESIVHPLSFYGRTILTKEESENIPEEIVFKQALKELINSKELLNYVEKYKFDAEYNNDFLKDRKRVAYEVKLTIIPKNK